MSLTTPGARRLAGILFALLVASSLGAAPPFAAVTRAATPDLTLVADTRYNVQPDRALVHVTVDLVATNHLRDTAKVGYYFDHALLAVLPGTSGFRLTSAAGRPSVAVTKRLASYTLLQLNFGRRLFSGKSATLKLQFDLPDPGGIPSRDVRIGPSLVSFPVWAFASPSTSGGSVTVVFPAGYTIGLEAGNLPPPTTDTAGRVTYSSGQLSDPLGFFAYFVGDKPGSYRDTKLVAHVGGTAAQLTIRAWPDDSAWGRRVGSLFERGLPVVAELVGLPWERPDGLVIQEGVSRTTGGYAGLFDPSAGRIEVAYYADAFVVLHEASHAWFNGTLLADRWANEAFASYYALAAAGQLNEKATGDRLTPELQKSRIALNAWGGVGRDSPSTEDYAYAASLQLATEIAARAGPDGLRAVWAAAAQQTDGSPDWRGLLDLLEERTGKRYDDLWRTWVVRDNEVALLAARASARADRASLAAAADPWSVPRSIDDALHAWQFERATNLIAGARTVLGRRDEIQQQASDAGLTLPGRLKAAFESSDGVAAATSEADAEQAAMRSIAAAAAARPATPGPLDQFGLLGAAPEEALAAARSAFSAGDLAAATRDAAAARDAWLGSFEGGRSRLIGLVVLLLVGVVGGLMLFTARRRRRVAQRAALAEWTQPPSS
jgi:hypothetical protein